MKKDDLIESIARSAKISKVAAERGLRGLLQTMKDAIEEGERVNLVGFGSFSIVDRAARMGRNPQTGQQITIPSRRRIRFTPGKSLMDRVVT